MEKTAQNIKPLLFWLWTVTFMVVAMAVIGAITRLTESGLSITEWQPVAGFLPPLNDAVWQGAFEKYQQIPEFKQQHYWMELEDFKNIYWWEWIHRFWGRLIGIAYALPLLFFWVRGMVPQNLKLPLIGLLLLGGAQGVMGWFMVMSGLSERIDVSHFRLAAHLALAFFIYAAVLATIFSLQNMRAQISRLAIFSILLFLVVMLWGAFTAGLNGGLIYNTWPLMGDKFVPDEMEQAFAFLNNPAGVQFIHRTLAIVLAALLLIFALQRRSMGLAVMTVVQVGLGIATVLSAVPIALGALHQLGAFILCGFLVRAIFQRNNQDSHSRNSAS